MLRERYCDSNQVAALSKLGFIKMDDLDETRLTHQAALDVFDENGIYIEIDVYGIDKPRFGYTIVIDGEFVGNDEDMFSKRGEATSAAITCCCEYLLKKNT